MAEPKTQDQGLFSTFGVSIPRDSVTTGSHVLHTKMITFSQTQINYYN